MTDEVGGFPEVDWLAKLAGFFHDPPHKTFCLSFRVNHEEQGKRLAEAADGRGGVINEADYQAAAADRPDIGGVMGVSVNWCNNPKVYRPTGGEVEWLTNSMQQASVRSGDEVRTLTDELEQCVEKFRGLHPRERFLALWRLLPEILARGKGAEGSFAVASRIGPQWLVLPADTRVPDHSIWSHVRLVSALQTALPNLALVEIRMTGIQRFISRSRSLRDMWAASWLASYLMAAAGWEVAMRYGPDCVLFPDLWGQPMIDFWLYRHLEAQNVSIGFKDVLRTALPIAATIPNRLVVLSGAEVARDLASAGCHAARRKFSCLVEKVKQEVEKILEDGKASDSTRVAVSEHWNTLCAAFPELMWVRVELPKDCGKNGLEELEKRAEEWLNAGALVQRLRSVREGLRYPERLLMGYQLAYQLLQRAVEARKLVKPMGNSLPPAEVCTVCRDLASLPLVDLREPAATQHARWANFGRALNQAVGGAVVQEDGKEALCGLCLVRRLLPWIVPRAESCRDGGEDLAWEGGRRPVFPSTGSVATVLWRQAVEEKAKKDRDLQAAIENLIKSAGGCGALSERELYKGSSGLAKLDGHVLLRDDLKGEYGEEGKCLGKARDEVLRRALKAGLVEPPRYYGVIKLDGDKLGRWLAGNEARPRLSEVLHPEAAKHLDDQQRARPAPWGPSRHAGLSAILRDFVVFGVSAIVEQESGALVYAGGDDLLVFAPAERVIALASRLQAAFRYGGCLVTKKAGDKLALISNPRGQGSKDTYDSFVSAMGKGDKIEGFWLGAGDLTISAGVAVAHYMSDLRQVVERVGEALEEAKSQRDSQQGGDRLVVAVCKRSGEEVSVRLPWTIGDVPVGDVFDELTGMFSREKGVSPALLGDLRREEAMAWIWAGGSGEDRRVVESRVRFLVDRHSGSGLTERANLKTLMKVLNAVMDSGSGHSDPGASWRQFVNVLSVAVFLARRLSLE